MFWKVSGQIVVVRSAIVVCLAWAVWVLKKEVDGKEEVPPGKRTWYVSEGVSGGFCRFRPSNTRIL